jgi:hypothetical protein
MAFYISRNTLLVAAGLCASVSGVAAISMNFQQEDQEMSVQPNDKSGPSNLFIKVDKTQKDKWEQHKKEEYLEEYLAKLNINQAFLFDNMLLRDNIAVPKAVTVPKIPKQLGKRRMPLYWPQVYHNPAAVP